MLNELGQTEFQGGYDYETAMKRRLGLIDTIDDTRSQHAEMANALASQAQRVNEMQRLSSMNPYGTVGATGGGGGSFASFKNAISGQESGGNYGAVNRDSGALGKYQVMPANVAGWSKQVLGYAITPQQFLRNPDLQEKIVTGIMQGYYNKYGAAGAAVAWYAGPGTAAKYVRNPSGFNKPQGNYPSIASYVQSVLARMR
jgi:hypothetical protein